MNVLRKRERVRPDAMTRGRLRFGVRLSWLLIVALLPLEVAGLCALAMPVYRLVRFDPAYFRPAYAVKYASASEVARILEQALQTGDRALLAELQGQRWPASFHSGPSIKFVRVLERTDRYFTYLYVDMLTYERYPYAVEQVRGRWVVVPPDVDFYLRSGQWRTLFFPLMVTWWCLCGLALGFVWLVRRSARVRSWLLGE